MSSSSSSGLGGCVSVVVSCVVDVCGVASSSSESVDDDESESDESESDESESESDDESESESELEFDDDFESFDVLGVFFATGDVLDGGGVSKIASRSISPSGMSSRYRCSSSVLSSRIFCTS